MTLGLAAFFAASAIGKIANPEPTFEVFAKVWHLGPRLQAIAFAALCAIEAALCACFLVYPASRVVRIAAAAFVVAATSSIVLQIATDSELGCGCGIGSGTGLSSQVTGLVRNAAVVALCIILPFPARTTDDRQNDSPLRGEAFDGITTYVQEANP